MVRKLLKYDLRAVLKYLAVIYAIVLGTAALNRLLQLFESDQVWYTIAFRSSVVLLVLGIAAMFLMTLILLLVRFYKNLFSNEGYLTFTLPATVHEHLWSKILTALICIVLTVAVAFLAGFIATSGEVFTEIMKAAGYLFAQVTKQVGTVNMTLYIIEGIVLCVFAAVDTVMLYETCLTIGQLAKKHRVGLAVGVFFGQYFFTQLVGTLFIIFEAMEDFALFEFLDEALSKHFETTLHVIMVVMIVISLLLFLLYYFIMHRIMKKRLNLE